MYLIAPGITLTLYSDPFTLANPGLVIHAHIGNLFLQGAEWVRLFKANLRFEMKKFIMLVSFIFLMGLVVDAVGQEEKTRAASKTSTATLTAKPAKPTNPGDISAKPAVLASAACCLKQCASGGTCGTNCTVVDSLSACSSNIKFECGANKGLTCVGSSCSCE